MTGWWSFSTGKSRFAQRLKTPNLEANGPSSPVRWPRPELLSLKVIDYDNQNMRPQTCKMPPLENVKLRASDLPSPSPPRNP